MASILPYLLGFIIPVTLLTSALWGGAWVLLVPIVVYGVLPLLDRMSGPDRENRPAVAPGWAYRMVPRLYVPVHLIALGWTLSIAASSSLPVALGLVVAAGLSGVLAINVAHELMHRGGRLDHPLAVLVMGTTAYPHFVVEHVYGHHRNVGTPLDPATSRYGESVWVFLPRTLVGSLVSAWHIEAARSGSRFGWRNRVVRWWLVELLVIAALLAWRPLLGALFLGQAGIAVVILEVINYVEHYGLVRVETSPGRFERTLPHHSWNSPERVTNWLSLNLQRHSDHHAFAGRPYEQLRHYDDVPQLPAGYPSMMLVAMVPPLWFRIMNPRVAAWRQGSAVPA